MREVSVPLRARVAATAVALILLSAAIPAPHAGATEAAMARPPTIYVGPSGSDRAGGTRRRPLRTLQAALARATPGTTILVRGGTYPERIYAIRSGTAGSPIIVRPDAGSHPVVTGPLTVHASHVVVRGLVFVGRTAANPDGVLVSIEGDDVTLLRNELRNASMSGVIVGDSAGVKIVANWIHNNGTHVLNGIPQDHGIYLAESSGGLIANNIVDHNLGFGIQLYPHAVATLVTSNTIVANGRMDGAPASGVIVGGAGSSGNQIVNNIVAWNGQAGVRSLQPLGLGNAVFTNLGFADSNGDFPATLSGGLFVHDNVTAPPRFVSVRSHDYRLRASSPALGRALAAFAPASDYAGSRRFGRRAPDLGALQRR